MAGVRIADLPPLGTVTDASKVVGEKSGSGSFAMTALRDYVWTPPASLTRSSSTTGADAPLLNTQWTITDTNGAGHNQTHNKTIVTSTPGELWANFDELDYTGPASTAGAGMVTRYIQALSHANRDASVFLWSLITSVVDFTNQPASVAGGFMVQEMDLEASGLADNDAAAFGRGQRRGLVITTSRGRTYSGTDTAFTSGLHIIANTNTRFKNHVNLDGAFNDAQLVAKGTSEGGAPHIAVKTGGLLALDYPDNAVTLNALYDGSVGLLVINKPTRLPGFTVAGLPTLAGNPGTICYASNGRNAGEGAGVGTGCPVYRNSSGAWLAFWSGLAVTA